MELFISTNIYIGLGFTPQQGHDFQPAEPSRLRGAAGQPHPLLPQPLGCHQREGVAVVRIEVLVFRISIDLIRIRIQHLRLNTDPL
jgi:hypothetical protein